MAYSLLPAEQLERRGVGPIEMWRDVEATHAGVERGFDGRSAVDEEVFGGQEHRAGQTLVRRRAAVDRRGLAARMPESLEELDLLLLTVRTPRKVQCDGIHLHGLRSEK